MRNLFPNPRERGNKKGKNLSGSCELCELSFMDGGERLNHLYVRYNEI